MVKKAVVAAALCVTAATTVGCSKEVEIPEQVATGQVQTQDIPVIDPSQPLEIVIPDVKIRAKFDEQSCRVKNGAIDPKSMDNACVYTAEDRPYVLPGTNSADIVVIAGHTGAGVHAVFNNLYDGKEDKHTIAEGAKLYIKTANSGERWIVYRATDFHSPSKELLEGSAEIWGTDAMPGRLLTISCIQPANPLATSVRNAVVGWQFEGVVGGEAAPVSSESPTPTSTTSQTPSPTTTPTPSKTPTTTSAPDPAPAPSRPGPVRPQPVQPQPAPPARPVAPPPAPPAEPPAPALPPLPPPPALPPLPPPPPLPPLPPLPQIHL